MTILKALRDVYVGHQDEFYHLEFSGTTIKQLSKMCYLNELNLHLVLHNLTRPAIPGHLAKLHKLEKLSLVLVSDYEYVDGTNE